jgi:hypothetical protein
MPKSNFLSHSILNLILRNQAEPTLWQPHTAGNLTTFYVALHTSDPGPAALQTANEVSYDTYARQPISRATGAWALPATIADLVSQIAFPVPGSGSGTATHASIGTLESGGGEILYYGPLTPSIVIAPGVTPTIEDTSTITEG